MSTSTWNAILSLQTVYHASSAWSYNRPHPVRVPPVGFVTAGLEAICRPHPSHRIPWMVGCLHLMTSGCFSALVRTHPEGQGVLSHYIGARNLHIYPWSGIRNALWLFSFLLNIVVHMFSKMDPIVGHVLPLATISRRLHSVPCGFFFLFFYLFL